MKETENIWVWAGYETFALYGKDALKIEVLSKKVGISKSSFYHHFADLEVFMEFLLEFHLEQSKMMAQKEKNAKTIYPELIEILVEHKTDLLFSRQLRYHQENKRFQEILIKSNQIVGNEFVRIWKNDLKLNLSQGQLEGLFELALENFFLQINPENLNNTWLAGYFENLKRIAKNFT